MFKNIFIAILLGYIVLLISAIRLDNSLIYSIMDNYNNKEHYMKCMEKDFNNCPYKKPSDYYTKYDKISYYFVKNFYFLIVGVDK